jgi:hypothetical protein
MGLEKQARSSVEECFLDAEEVEGSIPSAPTIKYLGRIQAGHQPG